MKTVSTIGEKIILLRKKLGITKYRLAKEIGTADINISNYENGVTSPRLETCYKIKAYAEKNGIEFEI